MTTRYTNRTAGITFQRCPRSAYLSQFYPTPEGKALGLALRGLPFQMVTGIYLHEGVAFLFESLRDKIEISDSWIDQAVRYTLSLYREEIQDDMLMTYGCQVSQLREVQETLIEGLLRGWALKRLPYFQAEYNVLEVEQDRHVHLTSNIQIDEEVEFEFKLDALLEHKDTGMIYVQSNKTTGRVDIRKQSDARSDVQGLSESWGTKQALGLDVHGVIMEYFVAGMKEIEENAFGGKEWVQWSPLVRGWFNATTNQYAWRYVWDKEEGGQGRLGKGWKRFNVKDYDGGVKQWVADLDAGKIFPSFGKYVDPLGMQFVSIEYYRNSDDISEWVTSITEQELNVGVFLKEVNAAEGKDFETKLNQLFPKYRHSCNYPSKCQFYEICHGTAGMDPFMNGYQWRTPHHKMQSGEEE